MTDPTPTRSEVTVARYNAVGYDPGMTAAHDGPWVSFTDCQALRERAEAAERRAYDLAVAIMGGEDAPGYADSIPTQVLVDQQREMAQEWLHRVTPDEARRDEAAAWNDAIEAVADFLHEQAADKGNTKTPQGRTAIFYRRKIRALRRAAPTEDRCAECDCQNGGTECTWIKSGPLAAPTEGEA